MRTLLLFLLVSSYLVSDKIEVTADAVNASGSSKQVVFLGNVYIKKDDHNWIKADTATVLFDENNQTKRYEANGNATFEVQDEKGHYKGDANSLINIVQESIYIMKGKARVWDLLNKRFLSGDLVTVNMKTNQADVKSDTKNKPVKFIFDVENKKKR